MVSNIKAKASLNINRFLLLKASNLAYSVFARVSLLGSPSVMNMLALLVRRMLDIAYRENEFMILQMKGFGLVDGTGPGEESKRTKRVHGWSRQIGLGTLFAIH